MCSKIISVALVFCLLYTTLSEGIPLAKAASELRCQCTKKISAFIAPRHIQSVEVITAGAHCEEVEVIITLKAGDLVCVNPSAPWVQKIINRLLESNSNPATENF